MYAIGTIAAAAFAALLYKVVTGGAITAALTDLVQQALGGSQMAASEDVTRPWRRAHAGWA